jgi:hypothetical protein
VRGYVRRYVTGQGVLNMVQGGNHKTNEPSIEGISWRVTAPGRFASLVHDGWLTRIPLVWGETNRRAYLSTGLGERSVCKVAKTIFVQTITLGIMTAYDRELSEKLRKLESIEARLAQHAQATQLGLIWLSIVASAALVLFGYHVISL